MNWSGIAEFDLIKHAETGQFMPIECNPKIWGTTLTTTLSGINFIQTNLNAFIRGDDSKVDPNYRTDIIMRYWFPEGFMHVFFQKGFFKNFGARLKRMRQNSKQKTVHSNLKWRYQRHHLGMCFNQLGNMLKKR